LPANASGFSAQETYEYDRNSSGNAVPGRGLITKITHADNTYQSFGYDQFGNRLWEKNELFQQTSYAYDAYNRVLTATRVMNPSPNETTTYTYAPSNGSNTSPFVHTTSNPDTIKTPTGIVTKIDYDENLRKISATEAYGTALAATTRFAYDNVGNLTSVTDPLSHVTATTYDNRDRKQTVTEASGTSLAITTTYTYDGASNITQIQRPDQTTETKTYGALNRVVTDTVPQTSVVNLKTTFYYNPSGTIWKIVDPNTHWTTFGYDPSDRKIKMTYQNGDTQSWTWDDAGNLATRTTVGGETQSFGYDSRNRNNTVVWNNQAEWRYFSYDPAGRLTTAMNGTGAWNTNLISTVTRSYDAGAANPGPAKCERAGKQGRKLRVRSGWQANARFCFPTSELDLRLHLQL
jgi:YD repeat-containing protein